MFSFLRYFFKCVSFDFEVPKKNAKNFAIGFNFFFNIINLVYNKIIILTSTKIVYNRQ